jgi:hypothetical protein
MKSLYGFFASVILTTGVVLSCDGSHFAAGMVFAAYTYVMMRICR